MFGIKINLGKADKTVGGAKIRRQLEDCLFDSPSTISMKLIKNSNSNCPEM
jgi:hypothetical protein